MLYRTRIIDKELDELLAGLSAVAIEGPKAVGKTATALQRAQTVYRLDDQAQANLGSADPARLVTGATPILIDEWQRVPEVWDVVRRAVDEDPDGRAVEDHLQELLCGRGPSVSGRGHLAVGPRVDLPHLNIGPCDPHV